MIHMEKRHWEIVKSILSKYPYTFYAFGSRARGTPRRFSDLDICFVDNIPWNVRAHLEEDFEQSNLPYKVDIIDWNSCDENFQNAIKNDLVFIQQGIEGKYVA